MGKLIARMRPWGTLGLLAIAATTPHLPSGSPHKAETPAITVDTGALMFTFPTHATNVREALAELGLKEQDGFTSIDPALPVQNGLVVNFRPRKTVHIKTAAGVQEGSTVANTVGAALWENGFSMGPLDRSVPRPETRIAVAQTIEFIAVTELTRVEQVPIPFRTLTAHNPDLRYGTRVVRKAGITGIREETVRVRFENGAQVSRAVLGQKTLAQPVPQEEEFGTRILIGRSLSGVASWYAFKHCDCAASTIFPRGTYLRVTDLVSQKVIIVQVNDYGPTAPGRIVDLDATVFKKFSPLWRGLWPVKVEEIL